jgi:hypothetical protein
VKGPGLAAPSGTVTFWNGGIRLGKAALPNSGVAALYVKGLPVGSYTFSAQYDGGGNLLGASSPGVKVTVTALAATTTLGASSASLF